LTKWNSRVDILNAVLKIALSNTLILKSILIIWGRMVAKEEYSGGKSA
jgi:hypothetical protein